MRANVDAWWPYVAQGQVEAIVMNASGCGVTVKEYGHLLRHEPAYADKASRISALTVDLSEMLADLVPRLKGRVDPARALAAAAETGSSAEAAAGTASRRLAFHPPCTLQHGQQLRGGVEKHLAELGFDVSLAPGESHLCCGSAGTYSVLHPQIAGQLRDRKLGHLAQLRPAAIVSANIGCITHLQSGTDTPVRHWVEVLDAALTTAVQPPV
jgi:glycolate oxidase iron-sulfur subunit